jgi:hypothetical protein
MAQRPQSPDQAFAELAHVSQQHNVKLATLASALIQVASGESAWPPERYSRRGLDTLAGDADRMLESPRTPMQSNGLVA